MTSKFPSQTALATLAVAACIALASAAHAAQTCEALNKLDLPATSIARAESVPAGGFTVPNGKAMPNLPAFCRVTGTIKPSSDSNIYFEVWMPVSNWNGKFQGAGNGGFAGLIGYDQLGFALSHNYATAATDTGHHAEGTDASWALDHPEKIADFGYRAIHETAVKAKAILHAFYGEDPKRSLLQLLLQRRPPGAHGSPALPRGLRWHHRRRSRQLLDAPAGQRRLGQSGAPGR
jgi:feruloyl esterase